MPTRSGPPPRPRSPKRPTRRAPLNRERILEAAVGLADREGLDAVTMRRLGQLLGVEAMSLYKHVANKDEILDGMADLVAAEIEVPSRDADWRAAIRLTARSTHAMLLRHQWASTLVESRSTYGPVRLRYVDAVIGVLSAAGFSMPLIARAFMAIDSHTYGFALQELAWPFDIADAPATASDLARTLPAGEYPNLEAMTDSVIADPDSVALDFEFGLDLLLDGLEGLRSVRRAGGSPGRSGR
jgi:AcrR family transcriptional regulator